LHGAKEIERKRDERIFSILRLGNHFSLPTNRIENDTKGGGIMGREGTGDDTELFVGGKGT